MGIWYASEGDCEQYGAITGDIYGIRTSSGIQEKVDKIDLLEVDLRTIKDDVCH